MSSEQDDPHGWDEALVNDLNEFIHEKNERIARLEGEIARLEAALAKEQSRVDFILQHALRGHTPVVAG